MRAPHRFLPILFSGLLLTISCGSSISIERPLPVSPNDWRIAGGSPARSNISTADLLPPYELAWVYKTGGGFPRDALSIAGDVLFSGTLNGEVHAILPLTGDRVGHRSVNGPVSGTPAVYGDFLFIPVSSDEQSLIALNFRTGRIAWERRLGKIESSPLVYNQILYAAAVTGEVFALDPETGDTVWKRKIDGRIFSSPAGAAGMIFVGSTNRKMYAIDAKEGLIIWNTELNGPVMTQPAVAGNHVFTVTFDSTLYSLHTQSGRVEWHHTLGALIYTPPSASGETVYAGTSDGRVYAFSSSTGRQEWMRRSEVLWLVKS
jgi:outer membrane protein assembly factor BamB